MHSIIYFLDISIQIKQTEGLPQTKLYKIEKLLRTIKKVFEIYVVYHTQFAGRSKSMHSFLEVQIMLKR